jgi:hypothetical protein
MYNFQQWIKKQLTFDKLPRNRGVCSSRPFLATGNVSEACRKTRVSRQTFYKWRERLHYRVYWKERFQTDGNGGIEVPKSCIGQDNS